MSGLRRCHNKKKKGVNLYLQKPTIQQRQIGAQGDEMSFMDRTKYVNSTDKP